MGSLSEDRICMRYESLGVGDALGDLLTILIVEDYEVLKFCESSYWKKHDLFSCKILDFRVKIVAQVFNLVFVPFRLYEF